MLLDNAEAGDTGAPTHLHAALLNLRGLSSKKRRRLELELEMREKMRRRKARKKELAKQKHGGLVLAGRAERALRANPLFSGNCVLYVCVLLFFIGFYVCMYM